MNDTPPRFAVLAREIHGQMSPQRRLEIASSMFDAARAIIEASLPPSLSREERRLALIRRFYGSELPEAALIAFAAWPERPRRGIAGGGPSSR